MWGLDPGKHTFGLGCFFHSRLVDLVSFYPPRKPRRKPNEPEPLPFVADDECAKWCGRLATAWMAHCRRLIGVPDSYPHQYLISEFPRIYFNDGEDNDRNDLLPLAACVGAVEMACVAFDSERQFPGDWKHGTKKHVYTNRIVDRLEKDPAELAILNRFRARTKRTKDHSHGIDACGIAMWKLGRMPR